MPMLVRHPVDPSCNVAIGKCGPRQQTMLTSYTDLVKPFSLFDQVGSPFLRIVQSLYTTDSQSHRMSPTAFQVDELFPDRVNVLFLDSHKGKVSLSTFSGRETFDSAFLISFIRSGLAGAKREMRGKLWPVSALMAASVCIARSV